MIYTCLQWTKNARGGTMMSWIKDRIFWCKDMHLWLIVRYFKNIWKKVVCCCMKNRYRENEARVFKGFPQWQKRPKRKYRLQPISHKSKVVNFSVYICLALTVTSSRNLKVKSKYLDFFYEIIFLFDKI